MDQNQVRKTIKKLVEQRDEALAKLARIAAGDLVPVTEALRMTTEAESKLINAERVRVKAMTEVADAREVTRQSLALIREHVGEIAALEAKLAEANKEIAALKVIMDDPDVKKLRRRLHERALELSVVRAEVSKFAALEAKLERARDHNKRLLSEVEVLEAKFTRLKGGASLADVLEPTKKEAEVLAGFGLVQGT